MNDFTPSVSVVVAVYNGERTIGRCIESLLQQDYPIDKFEVIVVENGSTDNTATIASSYPIKFIQSPYKGKQAALNLGIAQSTAVIIAMTDADCIAEKDWLKQLVKPYADEETGGCGGLIKSFVHSEQNMIEKFAEEHNPLVNYISGAAEYLPHLYGANCSYRRDLLSHVGGYNTRLPISDDVDICWRIQLETGKKIAYTEDAVVLHHHRSTLTGLARQYYHYGYGEILLDTLYGGYPGYPRTLKFQMWRIFNQLQALVRYTISIVIRRIRFNRGRATEYEMLFPRFMFLIERNNIKGKIDAIRDSRFMRDANGLLRKDQVEDEQLIKRFYQTEKM